MNPLLLAALLTASPSTADGADTSRPYDVAICLRVTDSPQLTPLFRETLRREVEGQMANYFGRLADVSVLTEGHWLIGDFPGWPVDEPRDSDELWSRLPHAKTFIVRIDYREDQYQVSWRELDRELRQSGSVLHRSTPDRQWVAKAVCLAVRDHLALVADVTPGTLKKSVSLEFRGGEFSSQLADMLGEAAIFQPYWVVGRRDGSRIRYPVPGTLLRVRPDKSMRQAEVLSNLSEPWKRTASVVGFEAVKVSTQAGRVRLRLVNAATGDPVIQCSVFINDLGFDAFDDSHNQGAPDREGYLLAAATFRDVAFVKIQGSSSVLQMPLPITAEFSEHLIKVPFESVPGRLEFDRRLRFLVQDVQTLATMQADAVRDVNQLNSKENKRYEEALDRARKTRDGAGRLLADVRVRLGQVKKETAELKISDSRVAWLEEQVDRVAKQHGDLGHLATSLKEAIDTREAGKRAKVLLDLAQQAEQQGDIDEALARYTLALNEFDTPEVRQRVETIRRLWDISDSVARRSAHDLIYDTWAKAELTELHGLMPQVTRAFETLKASGDYLRGWKLISVTDGHLGDLTSLIDQLGSRAEGDDAAELQRYQDLTQQMASFQEEVVTFVVAASEGRQQPAAAAEPNQPPPDVEPGVAAPADAPPPAANAPARPPLEEEEEEPLR